MTLAMGLVMIGAVLGAQHLFSQLPDREPLERAVAEVRFEPIAFEPAEFAPLQLVGAWSLSTDHPRVHGLSGIAVSGDDLIMVADNGTVIHLGKPASSRSRAQLRDLPDGPRNPRFETNRDSEAIASDPEGRGWWISFEKRNQLWLYDRDFDRALARVRIPEAGLGWNTGIEGLAASAGELLLFPERGGRALSLGRSGWTEIPFAFPGRRLSGAAALSRDSLLLIERRPTLRGFANALVRIDRCPSGYCLAWRKPLPVGWLDNIEGIAVEPLESGATRLWMISDDNSHPPFRTVLIAADLPPEA